MKSKYLIRLDDACPTMDQEKWQRMEDLLSRYNICPIVGIIPSNADPLQVLNDEDQLFWDKARGWQRKGWTIALHGFDHCYISSDPGINPLWNRSEFAGVSLDMQKIKICRGLEILETHGLYPVCFFAPSHTFDENTLLALRDCTNIRVLSDTIATKPYKNGDFIFLPQIGGRCRSIPFRGVYTFCYHPSYMTERSFVILEHFLEKHVNYFCRFEELKLEGLKPKDILDKIVSWLYFTQRRVRGIK